MEQEVEGMSRQDKEREAYDRWVKKTLTIRTPVDIWRAATAAERERCAKVAEEFYPPCDEPADISAHQCAAQVAARIRGGE